MDLKDRTLMINYEKLSELLSLYGELNIEKLVNNYINVAIDEIKEDLGMQNRVPHCSECDLMKSYDYVHKCYFCDHEEREDDMGKIGVGNPPRTSPKWCPKRKA